MFGQIDLKSLMTGAAGMAIGQTLKNLALDEECTTRVARAMYDKENDGGAIAWENALRSDKLTWKERAQAAILGLLAYAQKK